MSFTSFLKKADESDRYSTKQLEAAYGESMLSAAIMRAAELGVDPSEIVGVVADLGTMVGAKVAVQVAESSKGAFERLRLEADVNDISRRDQAEMFTALVPRAALPAVSAALKTSLRKEVGGDRKGPAVFFVGKDGLSASQDRGY